MSLPSSTERRPLPDGAMIAVRDERGAGPAIVWGHGLSGSMASEDRLGLIDWSVAAPGRRLIRYDARGHGESDSTGELEAYRWDRLATDQLAVADTVGVGRYVAAGASMGCATALYAALARPERVAALVLVIPPTGWETRREQVDMYEQMAGLLDAGRTEVLIAGVDLGPTPDPLLGRPEWKEQSRATLRSVDPLRLARIFRGAGLADLPPPDALTTIEQPALVLAWSGDPGHPVSSAERLRDLLPHSTLHIAGTDAELGTWSTFVADFLDHAAPIVTEPTGR